MLVLADNSFLAASLEIRKCLTDVQDSLLREGALLAAFEEVGGLLDLVSGIWRIFTDS
jgi:hypothetical protein